MIADDYAAIAAKFADSSTTPSAKEIAFYVQVADSMGVPTTPALVKVRNWLLVLTNP